MPKNLDRDDLSAILAQHIRSEASSFMPQPVAITIINGSRSDSTGYAYGLLSGHMVQVRVPGEWDLSGALPGSESIVLALPANSDKPGGADYVAIQQVWNGQDGSRIPRLRATSFTNENGDSISDHGILSGLTDDDHAQYHNDARGDARYYTQAQLDGGQLDGQYFQESEHLNSSAGAGDAGKPVKLDAAGHIDATMINDADVDHGTTGGLSDDDHSQYGLLAGRSGGQTLIGSTDSGEDLILQSTGHATKGVIKLDDSIAVKASSILTISVGAVTAVGPYHIIAAASGTTDDLNTITAAASNTLLIIQADAGDTITVKDGGGNIQLNGGADFSLVGDATLLLFYDGTNWADLGVGGGGGGGGGGVSTTTATLFAATLLHDEELGSAGAFDVSSISQDYDHLELVLLLRSDVAAVADGTYLFFNNDTTIANYRVVDTLNAASDFPRPVVATGANSPAGYFGMTRIFIPFYTDSHSKVAKAHGGERRDATAINRDEFFLSWENTAAINRIQLRTDNHATDLFEAGSRLQIWGWKDTTVVTDVTGGGATELTDLSDVNTAGVTKGNLLVADGTDYEAVGVGSNDQVLTADSAQSEGVKWADAAGGDGLLGWLGIFL